MRELLIQAPKDRAEAVIAAAQRNGGTNFVRLAAKGVPPTELIIGYIPNSKVDELFGILQQIPDLHFTLKPRGSIPLAPPLSEIVEKVTRVEPRSPIEVFLSGLQSIGTWKSFMGYTVAAGVVGWVGLFTNTVYLLVAAMLIAPFAGPAMNVAMATAKGDYKLLRSSLVRFFAAIGAAILVAFVLSILLMQTEATPLMLDISRISIVTALLPIAAGAAGSLNLVQSERNSLVSGAAVGMLVASSLSPPTALVGMAISIGRWDLAGSGVFVLLTQLVGINLSGSAVFRLYGLKPREGAFRRGSPRVSVSSLVLTAAAFAVLLFIQFSTTPALERSSLAQRAAAEIQKVIRESGTADPVEADVRFTRTSPRVGASLLCVVYVKRKPDINLTSEEIKSEITRSIQRRLTGKEFNAEPLVSVTVIDPAAHDGR